MCIILWKSKNAFDIKDVKWKIAKKEVDMLSVRGIFENGKLRLNEKIDIPKPVEVIVTFLDNVHSEKKINLKQFSFTKAQEILKNYKGSLSDAIIEERESDL